MGLSSWTKMSYFVINKMHQQHSGNINTWILVSLICLITIIATDFMVNHYRNNCFTPQKFRHRSSQWKTWRSAGAQQKLKTHSLDCKSFTCNHNCCHEMNISGCDQNVCILLIQCNFRVVSVGLHRKNSFAEDKSKIWALFPPHWSLYQNWFFLIFVPLLYIDR